MFYLQLLVGQSATTAPTTSVSAQSPLSETNPPSLSPNGGTQPGALSPGALSQTSQNAGTTAASLSNGAGANGGASNSTSTCCENGRPIMTDPVSGQTVCSCQYDSARLALSSYSRLPSAGVYGTPYPSTDQNPYPSIGVDSSAFYSPLVSIHFILISVTSKLRDSQKCVSGRLNIVTSAQAHRNNLSSLIAIAQKKKEREKQASKRAHEGI